jgi:hypothetical protein
LTFDENAAEQLREKLDQDNPVWGILNEYVIQLQRDAGDGGREPTRKRLKDPIFY